MKKFLFLFAVMMCVGLCSCTINVNEKPIDTGKIKVVFRLSDRYQSGWEVIDEVKVIDADTDKVVDTYDKDIWDDDAGKERCGCVFNDLEPGNYYVQIHVFSYYNNKYLDPFETKPKYLRAGRTLTAVYDGGRFRFE